MYTWLAITFLGLNVEILNFWLPDLNNYWHAQSILTLFGMRVPLSCLLGVYQVMVGRGKIMTKYLIH
jgi:hypothetical protein